MKCQTRRDACRHTPPAVHYAHGIFESAHIAVIHADTIALPPLYLESPSALMSNAFLNRQFSGHTLAVLSAYSWAGAAKRSALLAGISLLGACTAISTVDSRQDGHLTLTSRARCSFTSWNHVKNVGLKHAAAYCKAQQTQFHLVAVHTEGVWGVTDQMVEVVFDCF